MYVLLIYIFLLHLKLVEEELQIVKAKFAGFFPLKLKKNSEKKTY